jgi:hypothetical protein
MTPCDSTNQLMKVKNNNKCLRLQTNFKIFPRYLGKGFSRRQRAHSAEFSKTHVEAKTIFTKRWPTSGIPNCEKILTFQFTCT